MSRRRRGCTACGSVQSARGRGAQVILMAGLQGVGKTTACGKLALALRKRNKKVLRPRAPPRPPAHALHPPLICDPPRPPASSRLWQRCWAGASMTHEHQSAGCHGFPYLEAALVSSPLYHARFQETHLGVRTAGGRADGNSDPTAMGCSD